MHNWKNVLKKGRRAISDKQKKLLDDLMADGKGRTSRQAIEDLYDKMPKVVERPEGKYIRQKYEIPTEEQVKFYFGKNYENVGRETRAGLQEGKIKYIKKAEAGDVIFGEGKKEELRELVEQSGQKNPRFAIEILNVPLRFAKFLKFPSNFDKLLELNAKNISDEDFSSLLQRANLGKHANEYQKIIDDFVEMLKGNYISPETPKEKKTGIDLDNPLYRRTSRETWKLPDWKDSLKLKSIRKNVNYSAVVLDDESRNYLLSLPMPEGWKPFAHHMTITLGALVHPKGKHDFSENYSVGDKVTLPIIAIGRDDRVMAVKVKAEGTNLKHTKFPHVTVAINPDGGKPFHSQKIPEENFKPHKGTLTGIVTEVKQ
jgi:hypothetical protein